jgi:hypothetical protein
MERRVEKSYRRAVGALLRAARVVAMRGIAVVIVGVVAIVGCGGSEPRVAPKRALRGVRVKVLTCPARAVSPAASPTPIGAVQTILLCPLDVPNSSSKPVTLRTGQPEFTVLSTALSVADETPSTGPCALYADAPQTVLAQAREGVYQISIPTDACRHYQRDALEALDRARRA